MAATVGIGTVLAIIAGLVAGARRAWRSVALAGGLTGSLGIVLLWVIEADAAALIPGGLAVAAAVGAAARTAVG